MSHQTAFTLTNPQNGHLAFKVFPFDNAACFDHIQRNNYYSLIWVTEGAGSLKADFSNFEIAKDHLYSFAPYQPFMFAASALKGVAIHFHPDFFCIHAHQAEVACNGILFNNIYHPPFIEVNAAATATFNMVIDQLKVEMQNQALAQYDLLISYLKIFLITATRLKAEQEPSPQAEVSKLKEPFILQNLKEAIEKDFKTKHSASDYADALNISSKALAKITKTHFNKTLTDLIAERIIIEAKPELYLTKKPVKEIAFELGYNDEHYFSRFFKNNADVSPQMYRDTVGFGKGG